MLTTYLLLNAMSKEMAFRQIPSIRYQMLVVNIRSAVDSLDIHLSLVREAGA